MKECRWSGNVLVLKPVGTYSCCCPHEKRGIAEFLDEVGTPAGYNNRDNATGTCKLRLIGGRMQRVVILGAGGLAREVLDIFLAINGKNKEYEILGFIDENPTMHGKELNGFPVLGDFSWFKTVDIRSIRVICAIGNPATRRKVVLKALNLGLEFCDSVIHPTSVVTPFVNLGKGVVITAGCIFTNQIRVGNYVYVNLDCTIGHDSIIEDYCNINPGVHISGNVHVKTGCDIGTGAVIIQGVTIGEWSIIGAGAVVVDDIPANVTAVGVPARVIKTREEGWYER